MRKCVTHHDACECRGALAKQAWDSLLSERDSLQAELAGARAGGAHSCHANCSNPACKIRRERDSLRAELAQTRALLAARTGALELCRSALWAPQDEFDTTDGNGSYLMQRARDSTTDALASTGTEELAAIKGAIRYLEVMTNYYHECAGGCKHGSADEALNALKKYFGEGE